MTHGLLSVPALAAHLGPGAQRIAADAVQYGYVAPLITAGMGGMRVEDIALEGLRRGISAIVYLETVAALKESMWKFRCQRTSARTRYRSTKRRWAVSGRSCQFAVSRNDVVADIHCTVSSKSRSA